VTGKSSATNPFRVAIIDRERPFPSAAGHGKAQSLSFENFTKLAIRESFVQRRACKID
jgi:hypothetical protein